MEVFKEEIIRHTSLFPVDIFIRDNLKENIIADPHWHDCYEILYILEGRAYQQISNKHFLAHKNDLIILNQGDIHSTYSIPGQNTRILVIKFLPTIIDSSFSTLFECKYVLSFINYRSESIYHLQDTSKGSSQLFNLMLGLYEEFCNKNAGYEIYIKGYILQLIASLIRNGIIKAYSPVLVEQDIIKLNTVFAYVEKNYDRKISLKEVASMINFSCSYFSRYFKKATGRTFKDYLNFVRICEVEKLILSGRMNVSQAAYETGFHNISSFNRVFKRVRGYSPREIIRSKTAKY